MERARPIVVRAADGPVAPGPPTAGMDRRQLADHGDAWAGWVETTPGLAGGWHHHGDRDSYIYVIRGSMTIEFGPGGRDSVTVGAGDFVFNPRAMVHRELTGDAEPAELFVVRVGTGPQNVNVDGPEPDQAGG